MSLLPIWVVEVWKMVFWRSEVSAVYRSAPPRSFSLSLCVLHVIGWTVEFWSGIIPLIWCLKLALFVNCFAYLQTQWYFHSFLHPLIPFLLFFICCFLVNNFSLPFSLSKRSSLHLLRLPSVCSISSIGWWYTRRHHCCSSGHRHSSSFIKVRLLSLSFQSILLRLLLPFLLASPSMHQVLCHFVNLLCVVIMEKCKNGLNFKRDFFFFFFSLGSVWVSMTREEGRDWYKRKFHFFFFFEGGV